MKDSRRVRKKELEFNIMLLKEGLSLWLISSIMSINKKDGSLVMKLKPSPYCFHMRDEQAPAPMPENLFIDPPLGLMGELEVRLDHWREDRKVFLLDNGKGGQNRAISSNTAANTDMLSFLQENHTSLGCGASGDHIELFPIRIEHCFIKIELQARRKVVLLFQFPYSFHPPHNSTFDQKPSLNRENDENSSNIRNIRSKYE